MWKARGQKSTLKRVSIQRVGIVFHSLEGDEIECMVRLDFPTTNNEEDFEALVAGLDLPKQ